MIRSQLPPPVSNSSKLSSEFVNDFYSLLTRIRRWESALSKQRIKI